ncbi:hypothetical protein, partial [Psychrobacter arcticus]|uniref:hypothetical protein n=1 Tax=Psychrobacter arcticus TaxID=334543 RepID=UPI001D124A19
LCLRRQRLQKIYTSNTVATLKYFNDSVLLVLGLPVAFLSNDFYHSDNYKDKKYDVHLSCCQ